MTARSARLNRLARLGRRARHGIPLERPYEARFWRLHGAIIDAVCALDAVRFGRLAHDGLVFFDLAAEVPGPIHGESVHIEFGQLGAERVQRREAALGLVALMTFSHLDEFMAAEAALESGPAARPARWRSLSRPDRLEVLFRYVECYQPLELLRRHVDALMPDIHRRLVADGWQPSL